jgi:hypothetical protein
MLAWLVIFVWDIRLKRHIPGLPGAGKYTGTWFGYVLMDHAATFGSLERAQEEESGEIAPSEAQLEWSSDSQLLALPVKQCAPCRTL